MSDARIPKFFGLGTRWGRNLRPLGFLDDVKNFVPNKKTGKLVSRQGYVADLSGTQTDVGGTVALTAWDYPFGQPKTATESPESINIDVIRGTTAGATKWFMQKPFYHNSATNINSWVAWGEKFPRSGSVTLGSSSFVMTGAGQSDNYYKGWLVWNSTVSQGLYCTGYTLSTTTFTVTPNIPSGWSNSDTIILYRHFHDNPGFTPNYTNACVAKQGNNILASGGKSSNVGNKMLFSGYKNSAFFPGTNGITYQETYVSEAEAKSTKGIRSMVPYAVPLQTGDVSYTFTATGTAITGASGILPGMVGMSFFGVDNGSASFFRIITGYVSATAFTIDSALAHDGSGTQGQIFFPAGTNLDATRTDYLDEGYYSIGYSIETDDGNRGPMIRCGEIHISAPGTTLSTQYAINVPVFIDFATLNKRIRLIHIFVSKNLQSTPKPDWGTYNWASQVDLLANGWNISPTVGVSQGWTFFQTVTSTIGFYLSNLQVGGSNQGSDAATFIGYTEPNVTTVSADYIIITNGRLFVAGYYDYGSGLYFNDQIRFSPNSGGGVPMYNVLPDIDDFTQTTIDAGDPNVITNIVGFQNYLFIVKTRGIYTLPIYLDPSQWVLNTISKQCGGDSPRTVHVTPYGVVFAQSGVDVWVWNGGNEESLMDNYLDTYRALSGTYASQWRAWYDPMIKASRIMITTDGSTLTTVYDIFWEIEVPTSGNAGSINLEGGQYGRFTPAIYKQVFSHNISTVAQKSDNTIYFSTGGTATYTFTTSATTDASTTYPPYFKIAGLVPDEKDYSLISGWYVANEQSGTPAGTLDIKLSTDGTVVSTMSGVNKSLTKWRTGLPQTLGQRLDIEFNTNVSPASWDSLTINEASIEFESQEIIGDLQTQI